MTTSERILRDKSEEMGLGQAFQEDKENIIVEFHKMVVEQTLNGGVTGRSGLDSIAQKALENHFEEDVYENPDDQV